MVAYTDAETGVEYRFVTNAHHLKAREIAAIYKERWQIERFFKWIKQNLKIKTFLGTSSNAVLTQFWIALCVYLLVDNLNFKTKLGSSMQKILRALQLNHFTKRNLIEFFNQPLFNVLFLRRFYCGKIYERTMIVDPRFPDNNLS